MCVFILRRWVRLGRFWKCMQTGTCVWLLEVRRGPLTPRVSPPNLARLTPTWWRLRTPANQEVRIHRKCSTIHSCHTILFFFNFLSCFFFFPNHVICSLPHFPAWNQCLFFSFQHRVFLVSLSLSVFLSFTCCASSGLFVSWCLVTFWLILTGFELWHVGSSNPFWMQSLILSLSVIQVRSFQSWRSCCLSRRSRIIQDGWLSRQRMGVLLKSANWCKNTLTRSVLHSLKEFSRKKLDFVFRWERISGRFKLFLALSVQRVIAFPFINAQPSRDGLSCLCVFTGNVSL